MDARTTSTYSEIELYISADSLHDIMERLIADPRPKQVWITDDKVVVMWNPAGANLIGTVPSTIPTVNYNDVLQALFRAQLVGAPKPYYEGDELITPEGTAFERMQALLPNVSPDYLSDWIEHGRGRPAPLSVLIAMIPLARELVEQDKLDSWVLKYLEMMLT
jgi:hypothetical protein